MNEWPFHQSIMDFRSAEIRTINLGRGYVRHFLDVYFHSSYSAICYRNFSTYDQAIMEKARLYFYVNQQKESVQ